MAEQSLYTLRILRLDLTTGKVTEELIDGETTAKYVGGTGLATKYLWEEVPAGVKWSDPENRLTFFTGPLAGTRVLRLGHLLGDHAGRLHRHVRHLPGQRVLRRLHAPERHRRRSSCRARPTGGCAFTSRTASCTCSTRSTCSASTPGRPRTRSPRRSASRCSVFSIGPAGENLVRFAAIVGDRGHVAAHNGVGAVMGSKKIKCISAAKGDVKPRVLDQERLVENAKKLAAFTKEVDPGLVNFGTNAGLAPLGHGRRAHAQLHHQRVPRGQQVRARVHAGAQQGQALVLLGLQRRPLPHHGGDRRHATTASWARSPSTRARPRWAR